MKTKETFSGMKLEDPYPKEGGVKSSAVILGDGGVGDFGSGVIAERTEVPNAKKSEEELVEELDEGQAQKKGRVMVWAAEFLRERDDERERQELQGKMGKFAVFANSRRAELGLEMEEAA